MSCNRVHVKVAPQVDPKCDDILPWIPIVACRGSYHSTWSTNSQQYGIWYVFYPAIMDGMCSTLVKPLASHHCCRMYTNPNSDIGLYCEFRLFDVFFLPHGFSSWLTLHFYPLIKGHSLGHQFLCQGCPCQLWEIQLYRLQLTTFTQGLTNEWKKDINEQYM